MKSNFYTSESRMLDILKDNFRRTNLLDLLGVKYDFSDDLSVIDLCNIHNIKPDLFLHICNIYTFDDYLLEENIVGEFPVNHAMDYIIKANHYFMDEIMVQVEEDYNNIKALLPDRYIDGFAGLFEGFKSILKDHISGNHEIFMQYRKHPKSITTGQIEYIIGQESKLNLNLDSLIKYLSEIPVTDEYKIQVDHLKFFLIFLRRDFDRHNTIQNATFRRLYS